MQLVNALKQTAMADLKRKTFISLIAEGRYPALLRDQAPDPASGTNPHTSQSLL
jgi:hypothetical protein